MTNSKLIRPRVAHYMFGYYAILNAVQGFMPELGIAREDIVFVSGIGCAARFPYYLDTYGMHSIHGRAPAIATGIATAREDLSVWVVTGDGDALSIGGNHLIHALRRNVNMTILLFNNRIYGLTKGQYSPTSEPGKVTKSTPMGSLDNPFNPVSLALGAEGTFVARTIDSDRKHLTQVLSAAAAHRGTAFVEIYQNCPIFNDGAFDAIKDNESKADAIIPLVHGEPIRFGNDGQRGVVRDPATGGVRIVDPTIFRFDDRWWLFCSEPPPRHTSTLRAYFADALAGPWTAHPLNPLKRDVASSRPAGRPFVIGDRLYRPAQDCHITYGGAVQIMEVLTLTPAGFRETVALRLEPDPAWPYPDGLHHLVVDGTRVYFDAKRRLTDFLLPFKTRRR